ncbi:DUF1016 family protein [bacterium]|nr:DUF1016 family protein [bacterium]
MTDKRTAGKRTIRNQADRKHPAVSSSTTSSPERADFALPSGYQFCLACREIDAWLGQTEKLSTVSREVASDASASNHRDAIVATVSRGIDSPELSLLMTGLSWSHRTQITTSCSLPHETPSIGLVLCRSADRVQMRLALTAVAEQVEVATYQTALTDQRFEQLSRLRETSHDD